MTMGKSFLQKAREEHDAIGRFTAANNSIELNAAIENLVPVLREAIESGRRFGLHDGTMHLLSKVATAPALNGQDSMVQKGLLEVAAQEVWSTLMIRMPENKDVLERALPIMQEAIYQRVGLSTNGQDSSIDLTAGS